MLWQGIGLMFDDYKIISLDAFARLLEGLASKMS
jgi:hypothetical protein